MWFDRVTVALKRLYRREDESPAGAPPAALEQALLVEHARLSPQRARGWVGAHRWAVASAASAVAAVAACQVPVDYEREFGASVSCEVSRETWSEVQLEVLGSALAEDLGADGVAIHAEDSAGPSRSFRVDLWGASDVGDDELLAALQVHAPNIPGGACTASPLAGTVHGTLGGRLGYGLLAIDLDHSDAEAARLEILKELERKGMHGSADVEIRDDGDGTREVKIRIEAYHPDHDHPQ